MLEKTARYQLCIAALAVFGPAMLQAGAATSSQSAPPPITGFIPFDDGAISPLSPSYSLQMGIEPGSLPGDELISVVEATATMTHLHFHMPGIEISKHFIEGEGVYHGVSYKGMGITGEVGLPELPALRKIIMVPTGSTVEIEVVPSNSKIIRGYNVLPMQPPAPDDAPPPFTQDISFYSSDAIYPESQGSIINRHQWRGIDVVGLEITPVSYLPANGAIEIATELDIYIYHDSPSFEEAAPVLALDTWVDTFEATILNYGLLAPEFVIEADRPTLHQLNTEASSTEEAMTYELDGPLTLDSTYSDYCNGTTDYLIIATHPLHDYTYLTNDFVSHLTSRGFTPFITDLDDIVANSSEPKPSEIRSYIANCPANEYPDYILLVGVGTNLQTGGWEELPSCEFITNAVLGKHGLTDEPDDGNCFFNLSSTKRTALSADCDSHDPLENDVANGTTNCGKSWGRGGTDLYYVANLGGAYDPTDTPYDSRIGRLSAINTSELYNILKKIIINYDNGGTAHKPKRKALLLMGDPSDLSGFTSLEKEDSASLNALGILTKKISSRFGETNLENFLDAVNSGVALILTKGHGGKNSISAPYVTSSKLEFLSNHLAPNAYPIMLSTQCLTGAFNRYSDDLSHPRRCFAEAITTETIVYSEAEENYHAVLLKGAIGYMGPSRSANSSQSNNLLSSILPVFSTNLHLSVGELIRQGKHSYYSNYGTEAYAKEILEQYNYFGDPSSDINPPFADQAAAWPLTEHLYDASGHNDTDLWIYGSTTLSPDPIWSIPSLELTGSSLSFAYNYTSSAMNNLDDAVTVSAWFLPENTTNGYVISRNNVFSILVDQASTKAITITIGTSISESIPFDAPDVWSNVAFTYDSDTLRIFLDGELEVEKSVGVADLTPSAVTYIGRRNISGNYFKGHINMIKVFSRPLDEEEIVSIFESERNEHAYYAGYWTGDETDDYSGNDNDIQWYTFSHVNKLGLFNSAEYFDGYVDTTLADLEGSHAGLVANDNSFELSDHDTMTISGWIKAGVQDRGAIEPAVTPSLIWKGEDYGNLWDESYRVEYSSTNPTSLLSLSNNDFGNDHPGIEPMTWHHVAFTYSKDEGVVSTFLDGLLQSATPYASGIIGSDEDLYLGLGLEGYIDELKLSKRSLPSEKILDDAALEGPIVHVSFDDPNFSGTSFVNHVSGMTQATVIGGVSQMTSGVFDSTALFDGTLTPRAGDFDGSTGYLSINNPSAPTKIDPLTDTFPDGFTISAWIDGDEGIIVSKGAIGFGDHSFTLYLAPGNSYYAYLTLVVNGSTHSTSFLRAQTTPWDHVVARYDAALGEVSLIVNGLEWYNGSFDETIEPNTAPFFIGGVSGAPLYTGGMDEVIVYRHPLSDATVAKLFNYPEWGMTGFWCFDNPTGVGSDPGFWRDCSSNGNDAYGSYPDPSSFPDNTALYEDGRKGNALALDHGALMIAASSDLDTLEDAMSISLWFRQDEAQDERCIFELGSLTNVDNALSVYYHNTSDNAYLTINMQGTGGYQTSTVVSETKVYLPDDARTWNHLALTWSKQSGLLHVYLDGSLVKMVKRTKALLTPSSDLVLGGRANATGQDYYDDFIGKIDQVRLFNKALGAGEVRWIYDIEALDSHYSFDALNDTLFYDAGGSTNAMEAYGAPTVVTYSGSTRTSVKGRALQLPYGTNNYLKVESSPSLANAMEDEVFIAAFVKTTGTRLVVTKGTASQVDYSLYVSDISKGVGLYLEDTWYWSPAGIATWVQGGWNHITARYFQQPAPDNGTLEIAVNGLLVKTETGLSKTISNEGDLYIGYNPMYPTSCPSATTVDEVYVSDDGTYLRDSTVGLEGKDLLNFPWISTLYISCSGSIQDDSPWNNNVASSTGISYVTGYMGQAAELNGTSEKIKIQDSPSISGPKDEFVLSFWIKNLTTSTLNNGTHQILWKGPSATSVSQNELKVSYKVDSGSSESSLLGVKLNQHEVWFKESTNANLLPANTWVNIDIHYNRFEDEGSEGDQLSVYWNTSGAQPERLQVASSSANVPISQTVLDSFHPLIFQPKGPKINDEYVPFPCALDEITMFAVE